VNFHPTYPFEENINEPDKFLRTRCPAWCDRVLFTHGSDNVICQVMTIHFFLLICMSCITPRACLTKVASSFSTEMSIGIQLDG